jgi:chromosome segregation ATPase
MAADGGEGAHSTPRTATELAWLKEFVLRVVAEHEKRFDQAIEGIRRDLASLASKAHEAKADAAGALSKAENATNERLAIMNEFRESITDREGAFARKAEVSNEIKRLDDKIGTLDDKIGTLASRQQTLGGENTAKSSAWQIILSSMSLVIALGAVFVAALK